jgi:hypothetical protein
MSQNLSLFPLKLDQLKVKFQNSMRLGEFAWRLDTPKEFIFGGGGHLVMKLVIRMERSHSPDNFCNCELIDTLN